MENTLNKRLPLSRIQKLIGNLMMQSKREQPSSFLECRANMTDLLMFRKKYCRQTGVRVTTNDFFFCAIARAIAKYPKMSAQLDESGKNMILADEIGVGFAVAAAQGLVVPVIKGCDTKKLTEIAEVSDGLLAKARSNKLEPVDFEGANVVLSSLGMFGISTFYAINPPGATGIVSVGKIEEMVAPAEDGGMKIIKTMSLALAANLTIVDDFYAAKFLRCVIDSLEDPESLTVDP